MSEQANNAEQENPEKAPNNATAPQDIEALKAKLEEERNASAAVMAALAEREAQLAELQKAVSEAKKASEAAATELAALKDANAKAVAKYLDAVKAANTAIPADVIGGSSIEEIDASVQKALTIAESVKKSLEAQAQQARVPAGAPPRTEVSLEALSPRELIALGLQKTGGTS